MEEKWSINVYDLSHINNLSPIHPHGFDVASSQSVQHFSNLGIEEILFQVA